MLKSILVGLDGSKDAQSAVELGFRWAKEYGAIIVGIGIVDVPDITKPRMVPIGGSYYKQHSDEVRLERARDQVKHFLEDFATRCMDAGVVSKLLVEEGIPYEEILEEAQRFDLVLLGQHTHFDFASKDSRNNTLERVLRKTSRPVVVVPEQLPSGTSILIAYDGSVQAARALMAFEATGLGQGQPIHLVNVCTDEAKAKLHVQRAAEFLRWHGLNAEAHTVVDSDPPAKVILEIAEQQQAGLLVMGSHGQPMLREFFLGSVTQTILKESTLPLFIFH